jgi:hypothetical protein
VIFAPVMRFLEREIRVAGKEDPIYNPTRFSAAAG